MEERFAARALKLAGLSARALGWLPETFWQSTPAELAAILTPEAAGEVSPLGRSELAKLLEQDHDR